MPQTINVLIVGIGGQGALKASEVLSDVLVRQGRDVKQSEVHGMSQRGGSVSSEVRFGDEVHSPLMPEQEADYVLALDETEGRRAAPRLRPGSGALLGVPPDLAAKLADPRDKNMAVLGRLAAHLDRDPEVWRHAIRRAMRPKTIKSNLAAFDAGLRFAG